MVGWGVCMAVNENECGMRAWFLLNYTLSLCAVMGQGRSLSLVLAGLLISLQPILFSHSQ